MTDHVKLTINGAVVYEAGAPSTPTGPTEPTVPTGPIFTPPNAYAPYVGMTRAQIEYAYGKTRPAWWDWEDAYAAGVERDYATGNVSQIDKRQLRDLSEVNGPGVVEGPAGFTDYFHITRPKDEVVAVTCGRTGSNLGAVYSASLNIDSLGLHVTAAGSDCYGKLTYKAPGGEVLVRVVLDQPGALAVQRNQ